MMALTKYAIAGAISGLVIGGAYVMGVSHTKAEWRADVATINATHAKAIADKQAEYRALEQRSATDMAAIDQLHQQDIANREAISNRTIADLHAGNVSLRNRFTCPAGNATTAAAGTSTGKRDEASSLYIRGEDAGFFVRLADEADKVADQLRACQAVIKADREITSKAADGSGPSMQRKGQ